MVYWFALSVFPQFTDIAVVLSGCLTAVDAHFGGLLWRSTKHAQHVLGFVAYKIVVLHRIMAKAASIPFVACRALQLHISLIVRTSQRTICHGWRWWVFTRISVLRLTDWGIRRCQVAICEKELFCCCRFTNLALPKLERLETQRWRRGVLVSAPIGNVFCQVGWTKRIDPRRAVPF